MTTLRNLSVISPALVGRDTQLAALSELLLQAGEGRSRIARITGEAGIGKSRLVDELKAVATQTGITILQGRCFEQDRALPYAPLLDLLRAFCAGRSADELAPALGATAVELVKIFPELSTYLPDVAPTPALDPEQEKRRLFQALVQFVAGETHGAPRLVICEDLHWCDNTSLEWLLSCSRQLETQPLLLCLTYRDDEIQPALNQLLARLDRTPIASEFTLTRLTRAEVAAMLEAIFDQSHPPTPDFLDTLTRLTEGNPLFIEEILKALIASGDIFYSDGQWDRKPLDELRIPRTIQVAVRQRTSQLSAGAKQALVLAAVAGRRFDFALLQAITRQSESALLQQVKELLAAQLVVEESAETFAFRHALTREAVYADLLARERQTLHRTIAEAMERVYAESLEAHLGDLSYHFYEAGAWAMALAYARRAGDQAERLYAHQEAMSHYERARQCAETLNRPDELAVIEEGLGDIHYARGSHTLAVEAYQRALVLAPSPATRAVLKAKIGAAYTWNVDERGREFLQAALNELNPETQTNELAQATVWLARIYWQRMQYTQSIEYCEQARRLAARTDDANTLSWIYRHLASAYTMLLRLDQSSEWAHHCIALGERKAYPLAVELGYEMLAQSSAFLGQWQDTLDYAARTRQVSEKIGRAVGVAWSKYWLYWGLYGIGDLNAAAVAARDCLAQAQELSDSRLTILALAWLTLIETDLGSEGDARAHAELGLSRADAFALRDLQVQCECRRHLAHLHVQREEWVPALELFDQCAELLRGAEQPFEIMLRAADHAQAYLALGRLDEATQIIAENLAIVRAAHSRHFEAVARRVQGQIFEARRQPDEARLAFDEAIATLAETGSRLELARALYQRGGLNLSEDAVAAARADWTLARTLFDQAGARPMLWRTHAALGQLAQKQRRAEEAEREFAAARAIVAELTASMEDDSLREHLLQRAAKVIPALRLASPRRAVQREFSGLTTREREIAALIAQGKTSRDIAAELVLSERTVEGHVGNILNKLGFASRAQIAAWAVEKGLVKVTPKSG